MTTQTQQKWHADKIGNLGKVVTGKTPPTAHKEYYEGEIPFITPSDIATFDVRYITDTERVISDDWAKNNRKYVLPRNAITYVCIGSTVGKIGMTKKESITNQQINSLIADPRKLNYSFGYYLLRNITPAIQQIASARGAGKGIINKTQFEDFDVKIPEVSDQESIANVLATYDDLIENNTRRIKILEQMAQGIYTEWFVNFRFPDYEKVKMVDSGTDFGEIPEGWEVKTLDTVMDFQGGSQPPKSEWMDVPTDGYIRMVQIRDYENDRHISFVKDSSKLKKCNKTDIMIARYGASVARICWGLEGAYNVALVKVLPEKPLYKEFLRQYLSAAPFQDLLISMSGRTAQAGFNKSTFSGIKIILPQEGLLKTFEEIISNNIALQLSLKAGNKILAKARDLILPKLVTGEIKV